MNAIIYQPYCLVGSLAPPKPEKKRLMLHIFKTDIKTPQRIQTLKVLFEHNPFILNWSVDTEDIDNVLRIEALDALKEEDVIRLTKSCGYHCIPLKD